MKLQDVNPEMAPYIIINGDNHTKVSDAISKYYDAKVVHCDDDNCSVIHTPNGSNIEQAFCMEEEEMEEALNNLRSVYPDVQFNEEDREF